ncbi:MAG: hypothetical protein WC107_03235 [Patescibacteria group bacterium]
MNEKFVLRPRVETPSDDNRDFSSLAFATQKPVDVEPKVYLDSSKIAELLKSLASMIKTTPGLIRQSQTLRSDLHLSEDSNNQLISRVNESDVNVWHTRPAYFNAIVLELRERGLIGGVKSGETIDGIQE